MIKSRPLFCSMAVVWMAFVLSLSIAIPILFRPFYYVHINAMDLPEQSGYSYQEIKDAYDDMMDFCVYGRPFATGVMKYSEDGKSHFEDVAVLFKIDLAVLAVTSVILIYSKVKKLSFMPVNGFSYRYWGSWLLMAAFGIIGFLCALDFDAAFVTFHHIFFPGKTNWIFNSYYDEIITVLPEEFFRNCAIAIIVLMMGICIITIVRENRKLKVK